MSGQIMSLLALRTWTGPTRQMRLPAEASCWFVMNSSDGSLESGMKLAVMDLERGREWYQRVLGFEVARVRRPGQVRGPGRPAGSLRIAGQRGLGP